MRPLAMLWLLLTAAAVARGADHYVAPGGRQDNPGTREAPWDVESALAGRQKVAPGDTLWLLRGTYKAPTAVLSKGYEVRLTGEPNRPVVVRGTSGERVTVDGGLSIQEPSAYLWIRDLEITVSEPRPDHVVPPDPSYRVVNRPWGGLNVDAGAGCKFIDLVIHDNCQGVSWWKESTDSELYGCILYNNGWQATDRGHGHAVYTQNQDGVKTVADCIMTGGYGYTLHAYGSSRAYVDNYLVEGNIVYRAGPFLIGGGRPSRGIRVRDNVLFGSTMQVGYDAPSNEDCEVKGNLIVGATLNIVRFRRAVQEANDVMPAGERGKALRVVVRPNRYDPGRAHIAVYNPGGLAAVDVPAHGVLRKGERFRLMDPTDLWGKPLLAGLYDGKAIHVPQPGEFAAYVLLAEGRVR